MMNFTAALKGVAKQRTSYAMRSMSSAGAASTEIRKLGVVGAGQMVSTIESHQASMIKFLLGSGHSLGSISKNRCTSDDN